MIDKIKRHFRMSTPLEVASSELAQAELELLEAFSAREYANSIVLYNETRIARLRKTVVTAAKAEQPKTNVQLVATV